MKRVLIFSMVLISSFSLLNSQSSDTLKTGTFIDERDGHEYKWVRIGDQVWMAENLKATKFKDGTIIPLVTGDAEWSNLSTPGYCWTYQMLNDSTKKKYGVIYNWHTVSTGNLCPTGWHVPTLGEWEKLSYYLGPRVAGGKLKDTDTTHWGNPNVGATNETGFTALPSGNRFDSGLLLLARGESWWWTSTTKKYRIDYKDVEMPWCMVIYSHKSIFQSTNWFGTGMGYAVRCLKDN